MARHPLPELPWPVDALIPHVSAEAIETHHGKHHAAYVAKLEASLAPPWGDLPLEQLHGCTLLQLLHRLCHLIEVVAVILDLQVGLVVTLDVKPVVGAIGIGAPRRGRSLL